MFKYPPPAGYRAPGQPYSRYGYDGGLWLPATVGHRPGLLPNGVSGGSASLRFIASRAQVPSVVSAGTQSMMSRFGSFARDDITSLKLAWANWFQLGIVAGIGGNVMSIAASIEYPAGVLTQVKFGGVATGTTGPSTTLYSDTIPVTIPNGAQFWIRTWQTGTVGVLFGTVSTDASLGEASSFPGANQTMGGTVTNNTALICGPCAIIGMSAKKAPFNIGDSRFAGTGGNAFDGTGGYGEMGNGLNQYAWNNYGSPGLSASQYLAGAGALQADLVQWCTDIVSGFGINDFIGAQTSAQVQTSQTGIRALYPTKNFHVTTIDADTTSSDSWATTGNQTIFAGNAQRVAYNTQVRINSLGFNPAFDCAVVSESALNSGKWQVNGVANKYTSDGLHSSGFCYTLYQTAGFTL